MTLSQEQSLHDSNTHKVRCLYSHYPSKSIIYFLSSVARKLELGVSLTPDMQKKLDSIYKNKFEKEDVE